MQHGLLFEVFPSLFILSIDLFILALTLNFKPYVTDALLDFLLIEHIVKYDQAIHLVKGLDIFWIETVDIE